MADIINTYQNIIKVMQINKKFLMAAQNKFCKMSNVLLLSNNAVKKYLFTNDLQ